MWQVGRDEVNEPLDLMNHGIYVGHVAHVLHARAAMFASHAINLFPDFNWLVTVKIGEMRKM